MYAKRVCVLPATCSYRINITVVQVRVRSLVGYSPCTYHRSSESPLSVLSSVCCLCAAVCPCVISSTCLAATLVATWKAARRGRGGSSASGRKAGSMRCELLASVSAASRARQRRRQRGTGRYFTLVRKGGRQADRRGGGERDHGHGTYEALYVHHGLVATAVSYRYMIAALPRCSQLRCSQLPMYSVLLSIL